MITKAIADKNFIQYETVFNCISLGVHSSLEMSGLIATISGELFKNNIPANVFSGYFHDHIFVPIDKAKLAENYLFNKKFLKFLTLIFMLIMNLHKRRKLC